MYTIKKFRLTRWLSYHQLRILFWKYTMCSIGDADCKPYHTALKMLHSEAKVILKLHLNLHPPTISKLEKFQWLKSRPSGFLPAFLHTVGPQYDWDFVILQNISMQTAMLDVLWLVDRLAEGQHKSVPKSLRKKLSQLKIAITFWLLRLLPNMYMEE